MDRPRDRAKKSDPEGVGPSLSEGGERSGEGAALTAAGVRPRPYAASTHPVSNALLISGMFAPKLLFAAVFAAAFTGLSLPLTPGATSVARSHDPISWERATEKNRST